ncbi:transglutaminase-like domain-containing protein [Streptomyces sp. P9(2023)]|uniref:transglutaminase-like domain-containing protein n=1 Tax=Streptomyces sp. P9(2023) TaxID=3064394 RepID=UPI0028F43194|nr:transglutaminase-like domain-containing protein [Streptomyces sp. P9(2023)]MDT9690271.1 transglutaminase-like domain-containing protein [Streptomyces sp. P9(2023)]
MTLDLFDRLTQPTEFLDYETDAVQTFIDDVVKDRATDKRTMAIELYYAVRDDVFYEVYGADLSPQGLKASHTATTKSGFCLHKSALYAAAVRALGIPSKLVYGDVRNHLASPRLIEHIGGEVFFHGLTQVYLDGTWVKATPVFNKMLCKLYGMEALEFDGRTDSLYHPYEGGGGSMEFLTDHGAFEDVPYDFVLSSMRARHPKFLSESDAGTSTVAGGRLADEAK